MPVTMEVLNKKKHDPPIPDESCQVGVVKNLLYSGSKFVGFQKSKGKNYGVEVVLQV